MSEKLKKQDKRRKLERRQKDLEKRKKREL